MDDARTYAEAILSRISTDILNGELRPGQRLRLQALCETYQVSSSPLREALANLAGRGLVIQEGQRGFTVAPASTEDLLDVTETRVRAETAALRLSLQNGDEAWESRVVAAHYLLSRRSRSESLLVDETWEELHRGYHFSLIDACGSPRQVGFCKVLHDHFDRYRRLAALQGGKHPRVRSSEHGAIVEAVIARKVDRAEKLLASHIRESAKVFLNLLGKDGFS